LLVVIHVTVFDLNAICPTNDELARYEYVALFVPSDTVASREALANVECLDVTPMALLYQLLLRQNQLFRQRLAFLESLHSTPSNLPLVTWLQTELQSLGPLVKTHCQLAAWLHQGHDDSDEGPHNNLPLPKPSPSPSPRQDLSGHAVPDLGFN
jgi:hypothetical protein